MDSRTEARYRENLQAEIDGTALYQALAQIEQNPALAEVYARLAAAEEQHADLWRSKLREAGVAELPTRPSWRTRVLIWLARRFGPAFVLPTISAREQADASRYRGQADASAEGLPSDEWSHARLFQAIGATRSGLAGSVIAQIEGRHRATGGNALRAAVLGANDGLVSNASLVMGVAGADLSGRSILITGLAGLLAGSLSMALGEWLSVQSARELYAHQIRIEREELMMVPGEEAEELALIYQAKGIPPERARELATRIIQDEVAALDTMAREELGVDPRELGGSAWVAAITSFLLFSAGAIVPVIPFIFGSSTWAVTLSIAFSIVALFMIGAGITVITGRNALYSGVRQVLIGLAAAAITFGIGKAIGTTIGG